MRKWLALALLLGSCSDHAPGPSAESAGARLERAARAAGLVSDDGAPTGVYARADDRVCVAPTKDGYRVGVSVSYDAGNGCAAAGSLRAGGDSPAIDLGDGCRFAATMAQGRLRFPAMLPAACDRRCRGRASLAALDVERLSTSTAEAAAQRNPDGSAPCD